MKVIGVLSQKGGSGKTTISIHLAVSAAMEGKKVAIIDTDPQKSAVAWGEARDESLESPVVAQCEAFRVKEAVEAAEADGFDLVVIDAPPYLSPEVTHIADVSDFILIPVRPTARPFERWIDPPVDYLPEVPLDSPRITADIHPDGSLRAIRSRLLQEEWIELRRKVSKDAGYRCEACGRRGKDHPVETHDIWTFDAETGVQKLVCVKAFCPECHRVRHLNEEIRDDFELPKETSHLLLAEEKPSGFDSCFDDDLVERHDLHCGHARSETVFLELLGDVRQEFLFPFVQLRVAKGVLDVGDGLLQLEGSGATGFADLAFGCIGFGVVLSGGVHF